jgi:transcriptional regulator with AAA-type ATPase domain
MKLQTVRVLQLPPLRIRSYQRVDVMNTFKRKYLQKEAMRTYQARITITHNVEHGN